MIGTHTEHASLCTRACALTPGWAAEVGVATSDFGPVHKVKANPTRSQPSQPWTPTLHVSDSVQKACLYVGICKRLGGVYISCTQLHSCMGRSRVHVQCGYAHRAHRLVIYVQSE